MDTTEVCVAVYHRPPFSIFLSLIYLGHMILGGRIEQREAEGENEGEREVQEKRTDDRGVGDFVKMAKS